MKKYSKHSLFIKRNERVHILGPRPIVKMAGCVASQSDLNIAPITNVLHRLMHCMDQGYGKGFAKCFAEDGVLEIKIAKSKSEGREAIAKSCEGIHGKFCSAPLRCKHWEGNVYVETVNENTATNLSYWKALSGGEIVSTGIHRDTFVRSQTDGAWLVKYRMIEHTWTKAGGHV
jgi:hypothetical protein